MSRNTAEPTAIHCHGVGRKLNLEINRKDNIRTKKTFLFELSTKEDLSIMILNHACLWRWGRGQFSYSFRSLSQFLEELT